MIKQLHISNFKSIYDETIELGRFNVFIGENGSGKSNVLEALGMVSAASQNKLSNDELALKGIRVTKPAITFSSFLGEKQKKEITFGLINEPSDNSTINIQLKYFFVLKSGSPEDIFSEWQLEHNLVDYNDESISFDELIKGVEPLLFNIMKSQFSYKEGTNIELLGIGTKTPKEFTKFMESYVKSLFFSSAGLNDYQIFNLSTQILRGINGISREIPGIRGENLDRLIESFDKKERKKLEKYFYLISWLKDIEIDKDDSNKLQGHKLDMSTSILYFKDKYMLRKNNLLSAENANEGGLYILFYLALFISKNTPNIFAIDNIETALNPQLLRKLIEQLAVLSKESDKQVLITTHNPAALDGMNLHDDEQRLFKVYRDKKGRTKVKRIKIKPDKKINGHQLKLSELWMRGMIGAIPKNI